MRLLVPSLILLILQAASAQATIEARTMDLEGPTLLAADLAFLESDDRQASGAGAPFGDVLLSAAELDLEMDWQQNPLRVLGAAVLPADSDTDHASYRNATLTSTAVGAFSYVFVAPLPGAEAPSVVFTAEQASARPAGSTAETSHAWPESDRAPLRGDAEGASLVDAAKRRIVIQGDFQLTLWDVAFDLQHAGGDAQHWTGERAEDAAASGVDANRRQQAYLTVQDGRLDLAWNNQGSLAVRQGEAASEGGILLHGATGLLETREGPLRLQGQEVSIEGPAKAWLGPSRPGSMQVDLHADSVQVDGRGVELASESATVRVPGLLVGALFAALASVAAGLLVRRPRDSWELVQKAMEEGDHERVLRTAPKLLVGSHGADAAIMLGTLHLKDDQATEALDVLNGPSQWRVDQLGPRAYLEAVAYAVLGQSGLARERLQESIYHEPNIREEARHHALLRGLLEVQDLADRDVA